MTSEERKSMFLVDDCKPVDGNTILLLISSGRGTL